MAGPPPTTFDEFFTLAPKIKAAGIAPFAFAGKYPYYMRWAIMSWIWKSGGRQAVVDIDNLKAGAWKTDGGHGGSQRRPRSWSRTASRSPVAPR